MKKLLLMTFSLSLLISCSDIIEPDLSDKEVAIIAPSEDVLIEEGEVTFLWDLLPGASRYRLTVVSPSFDSVSSVIGDVVIVPDSTDLSGSHTELLSKGDYEWRLSAVNESSTSKRTVRAFAVYDPSDNGELTE